jgi:ABC-2 type transport system ATP-binding protein
LTWRFPISHRKGVPEGERPASLQASDTAPLLAAVDLTLRDGAGRLLLDAIQLSVSAGEICCLLGTAGSGKTALLHACLGLAHTSGSVRVAGVDAATDPLGVRGRVTYIARGAPVYPLLSARQNVAFFARLGGTPPISRYDCYNAMRRVSVPERLLESRAGRMTGALPLRLWLAIALLRDTPVLLIDEPTEGFDAYVSADLQQILLDLRGQRRALLIATSDILLAGRIADRVAIMREGRKVLELTRDELIAQPQQELYLDYMGRPLGLRPRPRGVRATPW